MSQNSVPLLAVVLRNLRARAGWTQTRLEREARLSKGAVSRLEKGDQTLDRFLLDRLAQVLAVGDGEVERAITAFGEFPAPAPVQESPADLPSRDWQTIEAVSNRFSRRVRKKTQDRSGSRLLARRWRAEREAASEAWQRLRKVPSDDRQALVETVQSYQTWAVVERLCEESARTATNNMEEARRLAQTARWAALHTGHSEGFRRRLQAFATAFEANALCAAGEFRDAEDLFGEVDALIGTNMGPSVVPIDWARPLIFRAVLLIYRGQLDPALSWLNEALSITHSAAIKARVHIWKAAVFKRKSQFPDALESLARARQFAELSGDARLRWAIAFNEAGYLCEAGDANEAASRLGPLRLAALELGGTLDNLRLRWLTARVAAASGHLQEASSILSEIWEAFAARRLWLDAAIAVLELASIELEIGLPRQVKKLATASAYVFSAQTLPDELLAAIRLFWEAALQETASSHAAQKLVRELRWAMVANAEAP